MFDEGITPLRGKAPERQRPGFLMAGLLIRVAGILLLLSAVLFNRYLLSIFDPTPPLDIVTARGIWAAQKAYFVSGLLLVPRTAVQGGILHKIDNNAKL